MILTYYLQQLSQLQSLDNDLRNRMDELSLMNTFLKHQKETLSPMSFLDAYAQHTMQRRDKLAQLNAPLRVTQETVEKIVADSAVNGNIQVTSATMQLSLDQQLE